MPEIEQPTDKPKKNSQNKIVLIVVLVVVGLFVVGSIIAAILLFTVGKKVADKGQEAIEQSQDFVAEIQQYPTSYQDADLPEYPGAELTNLSGKDGNPKDGIVIVLVTPDQISDITTYFDGALKQTDWQLDDTQSSTGANVIARTYKKGNQTYSLTISNTEDSSERNITISWEEAT